MKDQLIALRAGAYSPKVEMELWVESDTKMTCGLHEGMFYFDIDDHWQIINDTEAAVKNLDKWLDMDSAERRHLRMEVFEVTNYQDRLKCELRGFNPGWFCIAGRALPVQDEHIAALRDWIVILRAMLRATDQLDLLG